jgi:hypothetical protein
MEVKGCNKFSDTLNGIIEIQMKYTCIVIFLTLGIFPAGIFAGGKKDPPPPPPEVRQTLPSRPARPVPPPPPEIPVRPVTQDLLELIGKSDYKLEEIQYFISSTITVERPKKMKYDIALRDGEVSLQETNIGEKIKIPEYTGGVLIPESSARTPAPGSPRRLKICFDDREERTLTFRENPSDRRFYLEFMEDRYYGEFTKYGDETCKVNFTGEIPYIYIRLDEKIDLQPRIRELTGRFVPSREINPETIFQGL